MLSAFPSSRKLACLKVVYRTDYAFDFYGIGNLPDNLIHRLIDHRTLVKRILAYDIWHYLIGNCHCRTDSTALSGVYVRHYAYSAPLGKGLDLQSHPLNT